MPLAEARVSVMDRGFLFGDGVYEVIPVYSRQPFRMAEHLNRLQASLDGIRLQNPHSNPEWSALIGQVISYSDAPDQQVYLQITRGAAAKRNHAFPATVKPTVFMMNEPLLPLPQEQVTLGVTAISAADNRWLHCELKSISLLANCLLRQLAVDAGCTETVLFRDGFLTEGAASNVFVVKDDMLLAPPKSNLMLPGITYDVVLELAGAHQLPLEVRAIAEAEVRAADELWMTSSTKEVLAIVTLDGNPVGAGDYRGKPGPVYARMFGLYQEFKRAVMRGG